MARGDPEGTRPPRVSGESVPAIALDPSAPTETQAFDSREPRRVRMLAWALAAAACAAAAALLAAGAALPSLLPFAALVAVLAVVVNRGALYPSEVSST